MGEVLQCPEIATNEGKHPVNAVAGSITVDHVTFQYPTAERPAITDLCLDVREGESGGGVVGQSGAGKSTVMNMIIGFYRPTTGRIWLEIGVDMEELDLRSYRRFLAVVPQNTVLFGGTVRENVAFGLRNVPDEQVWQALELANAVEFVSQLPQELATPVGQGGTRLSGGSVSESPSRGAIRNPRAITLMRPPVRWTLAARCLFRRPSRG